MIFDNSLSWYVSDQVVSQSRVFLSPKMYFLTVLTSQKEDTYEYFGQMKYGSHFDDGYSLPFIS